MLELPFISIFFHRLPSHRSVEGEQLDRRWRNDDLYELMLYLVGKFAGINHTL